MRRPTISTIVLPLVMLSACNAARMVGPIDPLLDADQIETIEIVRANSAIGLYGTSCTATIQVRTRP